MALAHQALREPVIHPWVELSHPHIANLSDAHPQHVRSRASSALIAARSMCSPTRCFPFAALASYLRHGEIVHEYGHLFASRGAEVLAATFVQLHLDGVLAHEGSCRARKVDPDRRRGGQWFGYWRVTSKYGGSRRCHFNVGETAAAAFFKVALNCPTRP